MGCFCLDFSSFYFGKYIYLIKFLELILQGKILKFIADFFHRKYNIFLLLKLIIIYGKQYFLSYLPLIYFMALSSFSIFKTLATLSFNFRLVKK